MSLEKWERLHPPYNYIEPAAVQPLHVALLAPKEIESYVRGVGHGRQWWFCLACVEEMAERALAQKLQTAGVEGKLAVNSLAWFASRIMPECRIPFGLPGYFCLTSPERYALNLWVAHQLYLYYRCRGRLNVLTANFEEPLTTTFVGREGQTIYLSQDTRDSRGRLDNDTLAEITLSEVKNCSLTQALRKATVLILRLRKHQDTQQRQTRPVQHPSTLPTFNLADRLAAESLLALSRGAEMGRRPLSPLSSSSSTIEAEAIDTKPDLNLVPDWVFTQEHAPRTRVVSRSTNSLVIAFPNIPRSPPQRRSRPPSGMTRAAWQFQQRLQRAPSTRSSTRSQGVMPEFSSRLGGADADRGESTRARQRRTRHRSPVSEGDDDRPTKRQRKSQEQPSRGSRARGRGPRMSAATTRAHRASQRRGTGRRFSQRGSDWMSLS